MKKKGRSVRSGQVQGGNAQEGPRRREEEVRNAALQQYGIVALRYQAQSSTESKFFYG
jgi:hypothetical protein